MMRNNALFLMIVGFAVSAIGFAAPPPIKPAAKPATESGIDFSHSNTPVDIVSDQGGEFSQDAKEVIFRGNGVAVRGNTTVKGDTLIAYFRPKAKPPVDPAAAAMSGSTGSGAAGDETSSNEIWRLVADGHVEIFTPTQHAWGDHADYNIDDAVVVMTGDHLTMTTPNDIVTARDTLEYWDQKREAVARGDAVDVRGPKRIQADTLVLDFAEDAQKKMQIDTAHGYEHVVLTTEKDVVTGDRADYAAETNIVIVTGSVKMTQQDNQCDGSYAVVNLNTNISRMFPGPPGSKAGEKQVKCLFVPQKKGQASPAATPPAPTATPHKGL